MRITSIGSTYYSGNIKKSLNFGSGVYVAKRANPDNNTYVFIGNMDLEGLHQYSKTSDNTCKNSIIEELQYGCFTVPYGDPRGLTHIGYRYIDKFGGTTSIDGEVPDRIVKELLKDRRSLDMSINSGGISSDRVHSYLLQRGKFAEALNLAKQDSVTNINGFRHHDTFGDYYKIHGASGRLTVLPKELIKRGRLNEAMQLINSKFNSEFTSPEEQDEFLSEYGITPDGEYQFDLSSPEEFDETPYKKELEQIDKTFKERQAETYAVAEKNVSRYEGVKERRNKDILTLGLYEVLRAYRKYKEANSYTSDITNEAKNDKNMVLRDQKEAEQEHCKNLERIENARKKNAALDQLKQPIKSKLERSLVARLLMTKNGESVSVPNSVMFVGENPYMSQYFAKWTADTTDSEFKVVRSNLYEQKMISELEEQLNNAEQNWENTGNRTIIFVEGLEKLFDKRESSDENIAHVKKLIKNADKDFHSTVMFHTSIPSELDKESVKAPYVGMEVKVPISFNDANIFKN